MSDVRFFFFFFLNPRSPTHCEMEDVSTVFGSVRDRFQSRISPFFTEG